MNYSELRNSESIKYVCILSLLKKIVVNVFINRPDDTASAFHSQARLLKLTQVTHLYDLCTNLYYTSMIYASL